MKHKTEHRPALLSQLDPLHWCMLACIVILGAAGWFAALECQKARLETQRTREQFFNFVTNNQFRPMAPDHLK